MFCLVNLGTHKQEAAQRFALLAGGRDADSLDRQERLEVRKILEKPHRTHQSSARFIVPLLTLQTHNFQTQCSIFLCTKILL